jgi:predicted 3-demethylubiquinone-9 3-methyltransferase (glyoxalase superfamily)
MKNKLTTSVWLHTKDGTMSEVRDYYGSIFGSNFVAGTVMPLGETPSGNTEMMYATLFGNSFLFMTTKVEHHKPNDAVSFVISCRDQEEIDTYWNYFTERGTEVQCGWCNDTYGVRWQIIPENLDELLAKPNGFQVMMGQKKIIIDEYHA